MHQVPAAPSDIRGFQPAGGPTDDDDIKSRSSLEGCFERELPRREGVSRGKEGSP